MTRWRHPTRYSLFRFPYVEDTDAAAGLHGAEVGHPGWFESLAGGNDEKPPLFTILLRVNERPEPHLIVLRLHTEYLRTHRQRQTSSALPAPAA